MSQNQCVLTVDLQPEADDDAEDLDRSARHLRRELMDLDVAEVELGRVGEAAPGAKAGDFLALGKLIVHLSATPAALTACINAIRSWLGEHGGRSVKVTLGGDSIEVTGLSSDDQRRLVDQWIATHAAQ